MVDNSEGLVKIFIDFPEGADFGGESVWARPLGDDLYEVDNIPLFAEDINYLDVIRAVEEHPDQKPRFVEVVRRSGHQTIRLAFVDAVPEETRNGVLDALCAEHCFHEGGIASYYAIDAAPDANIPAIEALLWDCERKGLLEIDTD